MILLSHKNKKYKITSLRQYIKVLTNIFNKHKKREVIIIEKNYYNGFSIYVYLGVIEEINYIENNYVRLDFYYKKRDYLGQILYNAEIDSCLIDGEKLKCEIYVLPYRITLFKKIENFFNLKYDGIIKYYS